MANQVSDGANKDDGKSVLTGISEAQLQQLLSLLNDKDGGTSSKAIEAVAKPGLFKISSHYWIIDSDAIDHLFISKVVRLQYCYLVEKRLTLSLRGPWR